MARSPYRIVDIIGHPAVRADWNAHHHHELIYLQRGSYRIHFDDVPRPRRLDPGEALFIRAGRRHRPQFQLSSSTAFLLLQWPARTEPRLPELIADPQGRLGLLLSWLLDLERDGQRDLALGRQLFNTILTGARHLAAREQGLQTGLEAVVHYMRTHPRRTVDMSYLASLAGLKRSRFCERFKAAYGQSPFAFWRDLRLATVRARIQTGGQPLATIAKDCGFSDLDYLRRLLRQAS